MRFRFYILCMLPISLPCAISWLLVVLASTTFAADPSPVMATSQPDTIGEQIVVVLDTAKPTPDSSDWRRKPRSPASGTAPDTSQGSQSDTGGLRCRILSRSRGITFAVDDVPPKPTEEGRERKELVKLLVEDSRSIVMEALNRPARNEFRQEEYFDESLVPLVASRLPAGSPMSYGGNAIVGTFKLAWYRHLPVRLSPDDVWMAILNGISLHIDKDPKRWQRALKIRKQEKHAKQQLKIFLMPGELESKTFWDSLPRRLESLMDDSTRQFLDSNFVARFSTTTPRIEAAYRMKVLEAVQPFFEYAGEASCGIPKITLAGTPADWIRLRKRARSLRELGLTKWMDALDPILGEFIQTAQGAPNLSFWRNAVHDRSIDGCLPVNYTDGWIGKFIPIQRDQDVLSEREDLSAALYSPFIPRGAGTFPFTVYTNGTIVARYHIVSGFMGVFQDPSTMDVFPGIGWMVFQDKNRHP